MATNPRIPESLKPESEKGPHVLRPEKPKSGATGVALALLVAALLLAAIFYFMPRAPKASPPPTAATAPQQPNGEQIQLQDVQMSMAPVGGSMYIQGRITNTGQQTINGIMAQVKFRGQDGTILQTINAPVRGLTQQGQSFTDQNLTEAPLKPNDSRPVRIQIDRVPEGWNRATPEIQISAVTSHP